MLIASFNRLINHPTEDYSDHALFFEKRREILFYRILFLSGSITLLLMLKDILVMRMVVSGALDFAMLSIILTAFVLMRSGYQGIAKSFFLVLMNGFTFFFSTTLPSDRGIYLYFFPLITLAFAIFDEDEFY
ncbi:MAG TPA: hypothetical protein DGG95_01245, partial [Cytophagales bacterium]|nr:hypothetical protein [Cytophagales bacterium]